MEYMDFEHYILNLVGTDHFGKYSYMLPSIKASFRERFITTLHSGFNIPTAYDQVNIAAKLPEKNYLRYISFIAGKLAAPKLAVS